MTGQQLKNSILQLAIQGKLVAQDPNDEPASELLKRIRKEKEQLLKEKKIKIGKFDPDLSEQEVPKGWSLTKLGSLASLITKQTGFDYSKTIKPNLIDVPMADTIPMVQTKNFKYKNFNFRTDYHIKKSIALQFPNILLDRKCILLPIVGASVGNIGVYDHDTLAIIGGAICKVVLIDNCLLDYVCYFLMSPKGREEICKNFKSTAQGTITVQNVREIEIPLPPLAEQHRIVAKIEQLLPLVEKFGKAQEELNALNKSLPESLKKSILQEAIMGRLVPQDPNEEPASVLLSRIRKEKEQLVKEGKLKKKDLVSTPIADEEKPFEVPKGWEWVKLSELFHIVSARRVHQKDWKKSGIPFYRTREIGWLSENRKAETELFIDEDLYNEFSKSGCPQENDIMMTAVGTIGKTYIVRKEDKFYYKDASVLCLENISKVDPKFYCYVFESSFFKTMASDGAMGTTVATITMVRANEYVVPLPPLSEQHRIVAKLEEILPKLEKL